MNISIDVCSNDNDWIICAGAKNINHDVGS